MLFGVAAEVKVEAEECCTCTTSTTPGSARNEIIEEKIVIQVYNQTQDNEIPRLRSEGKPSHAFSGFHLSESTLSLRLDL
jgi:hypothetical protein